MDPLSVTASVVTVIDAAHRIVVYILNVKNASADLLSLMKELQSLRAELEDFANLSKRAEINCEPESTSKLPILQRLTNLSNNSSPLACCHQQLKALVKELEQAEWGPLGSKRDASAKAVKWPFKQKEITRSRERINDLVKTMSSGLRIDEVNLAMDTNTRVRDVDRQAQSIQEDLKNGQIFGWLSATEASSNHHWALKKRALATGKWFIESPDYVEWKLHPQSVHWLHGLLGGGKTVLASTIIDDLSKQCETTQCTLAYFYFFESPDRQDCTTMLHTLLRQLATRNPACLKILTESYLIHGKGSRQPSLHALLNLLQSMLETCGTTFIVLDALDECDSREELLELIGSIQFWSCADLHILLTSRSEPDVRMTVESWNKKYITNIQNSSHSEDIRTHIISRLSHDSRLRRWRNNPSALKEIEVRVLEKVDGMFLMADCQLDALQTCLTMENLITVLDSLPSTLNDTYAQILGNIEMAYRELAIKAFRWLIHSQKSITLDEMVDILAIDLAVQPSFNPDRRLIEKEEVSQICSNLIEVSSCLDKSKSVRLAHLSVREYLTSNQILAVPIADFAQQPPEAHASIAQDCLIYLLQLKNSHDLIVRDMYDRRVDLDRTYYTLPFNRWIQSANKFNKDLRASLPLIPYAAAHWMHHARLAGEKPEQLFQLMVDAFEPHTFEAWFHFDKPWCKRMSSARLAYATEYRLPRLVRHLLDQDIDVNFPGVECRTPLQVAAMVGDLELVELVLKCGARVNSSPTRLESALWYAASGGFVEIVELLLDKGADIENRQPVEQFEDFLVAAIERLPFTLVRILTGHDPTKTEPARQVELATLVDQGAMAEVMPANGFMKDLAADQKGALKAAILQRDKETFELLFAANFDVDAYSIELAENFRRWRCSNRPNPLLAAAREGNTVLRLLIDRGAEVNKRGYSTSSGPALYEASPAGHLEPVLLFLGSRMDYRLPLRKVMGS